MTHEERLERAVQASPVHRRHVNTIIAAYLGDEPLYRRTSDDEHGDFDAAIAFGEAVQVWPVES